MINSPKNCSLVSLHKNREAANAREYSFISPKGQKVKVYKGWTACG